MTPPQASSAPPPPHDRGHNIGAETIEVQVRAFNSLSRFAASGGATHLTLPAGSTLGDVIRALAIPAADVFLAWRNGRDMTPRLEGGIETDAGIEDGDVIALSGPVPYSWGYGAPIV